MVGGWEDGASEAVAQVVRDDVTFRKTYAMRKLAPDSGAYFNEVSCLLIFFGLFHFIWFVSKMRRQMLTHTWQMDINEPNWQYAAFGDNYPRLLHVKNQYDPEALFWCKHCVGSEKWVEGENGKLCRPSWVSTLA